MLHRQQAAFGDDIAEEEAYVSINKGRGDDAESIPIVPYSAVSNISGNYYSLANPTAYSDEEDGHAVEVAGGGVSGYSDTDDDDDDDDGSTLWKKT